MMRRAAALVLPVIILLTMAPRADACSCAWSGPFVQMAGSADLVIRGVVRGHRHLRGALPLAMDVEVIEIFKGIALGRLIRVWGDNGAQCRPYVTAFPVGTHWVFALRTGSGPMLPGEYVISICGEHWLKVEGANAVGVVTAPDPAAKPQTVPLEQLREILRRR